MCTQTSQVWCGLIIVHSNRLFVLLSALRLPGFFFFPPFLRSSNEISPRLQWWLRTSHCKVFSNWQGLTAQKSVRSPLLLSATTQKTFLAVWFQPGAKLSFKSTLWLTQIYLLLLPVMAPPLLRPIPPFFILFKVSFQFQWEEHGEASCLEPTAIDGIYWLGETKKWPK